VQDFLHPDDYVWTPDIRPGANRSYAHRYQRGLPRLFCSASPAYTNRPVHPRNGRHDVPTGHRFHPTLIISIVQPSPSNLITSLSAPLRRFAQLVSIEKCTWRFRTYSLRRDSARAFEDKLAFLVLVFLANFPGWLRRRRRGRRRLWKGGYPTTLDRSRSVMTDESLCAAAAPHRVRNLCWLAQERLVTGGYPTTLDRSNHSAPLLPHPDM